MNGMAHLSGRTAVISYGDAYSGFEDPLSPMTLAVEAATRCISGAGVPRDEIDGLLTGRDPFGDYRAQWNTHFASRLKLTPRHSTQVTLHSAGVNGMFLHAALAIASGAANYVLCLQSDGGMAYADLPWRTASLNADPEFELPYRPSVEALAAMVCRRYMHEYGLPESSIAAGAVASLEWARLHPESERFADGAITIDDVLGSAEIASPLRIGMCATLRRAGTAGAFLVTSAERAADLDAKPIYVLGVGELSNHEYITDRMARRGTHPALGAQPSLTRSTASQSSRSALEMAGLGLADIHIAQTTARYAHETLKDLEDLGFCGPGEAADFVADGHISPGGSLPYNTNGGILGFGYAGVSSVMDGLIEMLRQLRGEALGRQVPCQVGMVHASGGGQACHSTAILGTATP